MNHRLHRQAYVGPVYVAFTTCVQYAKPILTCDRTVLPLIKELSDACRRHACSAPAYCFMPDHAHVVMAGLTETSDVYRAFCSFKQRSGYWLCQNTNGKWQRGFHDHVIRNDRDLAKHVRYLINNPVRKGLVDDWEDYPYTGSIGVNLREVLSDVIAS